MWKTTVQCTVNSYDDNTAIWRLLFTCFMYYPNTGSTLHITHLSVSDLPYFFSGNTYRYENHVWL